MVVATEEEAMAAEATVTADKGVTGEMAEGEGVAGVEVASQAEAVARKAQSHPHKAGCGLLECLCRCK